MSAAAAAAASAPTSVTHHSALEFARPQFPTLTTPPLCEPDDDIAQPDGEEHKYDNDDDTIYTCVWTRGKRNGTATSYFKNRRMHCITFRQNSREGVEKIFNMNGGCVYEANWKDNRLHGSVRWLDAYDRAELYCADFAKGRCIVGNFTTAGREQSRTLGLCDGSEHNTEMVVRLLLLIISSSSTGGGSSPSLARNNGPVDRSLAIAIPVLGATAGPSSSPVGNGSRLSSLFGFGRSPATPTQVPPLTLGQQRTRRPSSSNDDSFANNRGTTTGGSNSSLSGTGSRDADDDSYSTASSTTSCPSRMTNINGSGIGARGAPSNSRPQSGLITHSLTGIDRALVDDDVRRARAASVSPTQGRRITDPPPASPPLSPTRAGGVAMTAAAALVARTGSTSPGRLSPPSTPRRMALLVVEDEEVPPEDVVTTPLELRTDAAAKFKRGLQRVSGRRNSTSSSSGSVK